MTPTFAQMAFAERLGVDFPLLSDWGSEVCESYGVRYDSWKGHAGLAKRSIFVVDEQGKISYRWYTEDAHDLPDFDEVMGAIAQTASDG